MVITITNHKGGVGKTTLTVNFASYFLKYFNKILVLDMDPQAHATLWLLKFGGKQNFIPSIYLHNILKFAISLENSDKDMLLSYTKSAIINILNKNDKQLDIIPSSLHLNVTKIEMTPSPSATFQIIEVIRTISNLYDLVLIDTPPNLDLLTYSAIAASDGIIIPIQLNNMAIQGAKDIIEYPLANIKRFYNANIKIVGVCVNLSSKTTNIGKVGLKSARSIFKDLLIEPIISKSVRIEELPLFGKTIRDTHETKVTKHFEDVAEQIYQKLKLLFNI